MEPTADNSNPRDPGTRDRPAPAEPLALGTLALLATAAIVWVVLPVGLGVLLGALLAFTAYDAYLRLVRRTGRPAAVALALTTLATLSVAGILGTLAYLLVLQGLGIAARLPQSFAPGTAAAAVVQRLAAPLSSFGLRPNDLVERLRDASGQIAASLAEWAARVVGTLLDSVLALLFMALTMHFILRGWSQLAKRAESLVPINPRHTRRLMRQLRELGRQVVIGNFGTALVQGVVAGIGYAVARVPQPAFLGAVTAVASLVPVFGTLLVWVPAGVVLLAEGHTGAAVFELAWGTLAIVGLCDYVVRPQLVGRGATASSWLTFVALFGGIKLFGFVGVLLGPLLVDFSAAVLELYGRVRRFRIAQGRAASGNQRRRSTHLPVGRDPNATSPT